VADRLVSIQLAMQHALIMEKTSMANVMTNGEMGKLIVHALISRSVKITLSQAMQVPAEKWKW
jgi:hypothetical protein